MADQLYSDSDEKTDEKVDEKVVKHDVWGSDSD
jgi:hypothetical protein